MSTPQLINEIRDINLSYLQLAQAMIRRDKAGALQRLGMSAAVAELLAQAAPQQLRRVASRNLMLCKPRLDEEVVWDLLTDHHVPDDSCRASAVRLNAATLRIEPMVNDTPRAEAA